MKNKALKTLPGLAILALGVACNSAKDQQISGVVSQSTFPVQVTSVRALRSDKPVVEAAVATDGSFSLAIPAGKAYRIEFSTTAAQPVLVFPRQSGSINAKFDIITNSKPFDLGSVRYVGDPAAQSFVFKPQTTAGALTQADADTDNVECEDGVDLNTGAVCVDDEDEEGVGECTTDGDNDNHECEDGIDPATGAECDGGPAANADDGTEEADGECEGGVDANTGAPCVDEDEDVPSVAAVADHNLPASIGCAEQDGDNVECEDGIDPATGAECDGGPAANADNGTEG